MQDWCRKGLSAIFIFSIISSPFFPFLTPIASAVDEHVPEQGTVEVSTADYYNVSDEPPVDKYYLTTDFETENLSVSTTYSGDETWMYVDTGERFYDPNMTTYGIGSEWKSSWWLNKGVEGQTVSWSKQNYWLSTSWGTTDSRSLYAWADVGYLDPENGVAVWGNATQENVNLTGLTRITLDWKWTDGYWQNFGSGDLYIDNTSYGGSATLDLGEIFESGTTETGDYDSGDLTSYNINGNYDVIIRTQFIFGDENHPKSEVWYDSINLEGINLRQYQINCSAISEVFENNDNPNRTKAHHRRWWRIDDGWEEAPVYNYTTISGEWEEWNYTKKTWVYNEPENRTNEYQYKINFTCSPDRLSELDHIVAVEDSIGQYWEDGQTRITAGEVGLSERNIVDVTTDSWPLNNTPLMIKIPVSTSVTGVEEVWSPTEDTSIFDEAVSLKIIEPGQYYYDMTYKYVYVAIENTTADYNINISVNCTYAGEFAIEPPTFLRSGDLFAATGTIYNSTGQPINNIVATTKIENTTDTVAEAHWNCSDGNYIVMIATTGIVPGIYRWVITFYDSGSGINLSTSGDLYLDVPIGNDGGDYPYVSSHLYYTFFDIETGTILDTDYFKFYISTDTTFTEGDRVTGGVYPTYMGQTLYYRIKDYFNNVIYPTNGTWASIFINYTESYIDVGVTLYQFKIKNKNESVVYAKIDKNQQETGRWLGPEDSETFKLWEGQYNLTLYYYWNHNRTLKEIRYLVVNISDNTFYCIPGFDAVLYVNFFNTQDGLGLPEESLKLYIDGIRIDDRQIETSVGTNVSIEVKDYYNTSLYTRNLTINKSITFLDLGLTFHSYKVTNLRSVPYFVALKKENASVWMDRGIGAGETIELLLPTANYTIHIYNDTENLSYNEVTINHSSITTINNNQSTIKVSFFNTIDGLGFPEETLKVYFDGVRTDAREIERLIGENITIEVKDYYNMSLYDNEFTVNSTLMFIDIGLVFHSYKVTNLRSVPYFVALKKDGASTWWEKAVGSGETVEFMVPDATYKVHIYNDTENLSYNEVTINHSSITTINSNQSTLYLNFFNANNGLGLPKETLKIYINGVRTDKKEFNTMINESFWVQIKDYYNTTLYSNNFTINTTLMYLDVAIAFHSYIFTNVNMSPYFVALKKDGASTWWEQGLGIHDTVEFMPPTGDYWIKIYNDTHVLKQWNETINSSKLYAVYGTNLTLILEGQSETNGYLSIVLENQTLLNLTVLDILAGQNYVNESILSILENFTYLNTSLIDVVDGNYYVNQTLLEILEQFSLPHEWQLPSVNYTVEDATPPISSITATLALGGGINVRWISIDNIANNINYTTIYYKKGNGSWRLWKSNETNYGAEKFTDADCELENGTVYWFRCIGTDLNNNTEAISEVNTVNLTYQLRTGEVTDWPSGSEMVVDALTNIYVWIVIIGLIIIIGVLALLKRRLRRKIATEQMSRKEPIYIEESI